MIPVTINGFLSKGVTVTVNHNGKPHDDFARPEGGVIHFRRSATDPLPGYVLLSGAYSTQALANDRGPPRMVLGTPGAPSVPRMVNAGLSAIVAIAPCVKDLQTSFGS